MVQTLALIAFVALSLLGALVFSGIRRGWMRNGYFTIPAVLLIVGASFLIFQALGGILALIAGGASALKTTGPGFLAMNAIAQVSIMLIGTVVLSRSLGQDPFAVFRLQGFKQTPPLTYILTLPLVLAAQSTGVAISSLWTNLLKHFPSLYASVSKLEELSDKQMEGLVTAHGVGEFVLILVFVAIVPALSEETLFRGFAQSNIERSGQWRTRPFIALILTAVLFAAIHVSLFKFPGLLALGLVLGWMAYRTNNLFVGALAHALNNGMIIVALFLADRSTINESTSSLVNNGDLDMGTSIQLLVFSLPFLALFLYFFQRSTNTITARYYAEQDLQEQIREEQTAFADVPSKFPDDLAKPELPTSAGRAQLHDSHETTAPADHKISFGKPEDTSSHESDNRDTHSDNDSTS